MCVRTGRDGVDTPFVPGMAFAQPAQRETAALYYTMSGNGIPGVGGAVGVEPAVIAQKGAQADLVARDEENQ